jgi:ubiquinone biosynthesis protein COQ4
MEAEELSVTDFAQASLASMSELDYQDRRAWTLAQRLRDMHDLIHVVSGYGRDLLGEMAVLSFSSGGRKLGENYRLVFILRLAQWRFARVGRPDAAGVLRAAAERGARAAFLPAVEWERLLPLPLSLVREGLGISPPPAYEPIRYDLWCTVERRSSAAQQGAAAVDRPVHSFGSRCRLAASSRGESGLVSPGARS